MIIKPFLSNKHSQNSKIKCFPFIFRADYCKATTSHFCNLRYWATEPSQLSTFYLVQISPLCDCSINECPLLKKICKFMTEWLHILFHGLKLSVESMYRQKSGFSIENFKAIAFFNLKMAFRPFFFSHELKDDTISW